MSESNFEKNLKKKNPDIDINRMLNIFDAKIEEVQASQGLEEIRLPLGCDLNKAIFASVLSEYLNTKI
jgi:hypothetical protein